MTIDLGGLEEIVKVHKGDDPYEIACDFCDKHGLGDNVVQVIEDNIIQNIL
jgi:hypothetical protein